MSTDLHKRMIAHSRNDPDGGDLWQSVWAPTPWMVDAFVGRWEDGRERRMLEWCYDAFGDQSSPIHEITGRWKRGNATVHGWTWFGFSTEAEMNQFVEHWPAPVEAAAQEHHNTAGADMSIVSEEKLDRIIDDASRRAGECLLAATDQVDDPRQRFIIGAQICAHMFGATGALFQMMPGQEGADRKEAADAVLQVIASYATRRQ